MSISSFCLEQREKEKAALKSILTYSIAGSAALHLLLAFGFALFWPEQPSLADDPIEIVVLDAPEPEPEIKKPELETPKPTPQPVVTPTPEKVVVTPTPEPIPSFTPEPIPSFTPEPIPTPKIDTPPTKVEAPKPLETPEEPKEINEPIKTPTPPEPEQVAEKLPPPRIAEPPKEELQKPDPQPPKPETETANTPQPLATPFANARDFKDSLAESQPVENEIKTEETPQLPGGLTANQQPPVNNSTITSQPLESPRTANREFRDTANATLRDRIAATNNAMTSTNPSEDTSVMNPGIPGEVTTNRENSPTKPTVTSQPLQTSPSRNRAFRDSFANSNNSPINPNPQSDLSAGSPGVPGEVTANNQRPNNRPVGGSKPLQTATNNRGFRDSFSNNNNTSTNTTDSNISPTIPGNSTGVAVNQPPARRNTRQEGENTGGNRRTARRSGRGGGLRCVSDCTPDYPSDVENLEGRPVVQFVVEADGSTANPQLAESSGNSKLDQAAVEAVRKMRFAPPDEGQRTVKLAINFATSGSDFERQARQRREENERQRRERERQRQESLDTEN
ncbi:hypothetical protein NIES2119_11910 [[Phormidium ambiguum] IAM M-71]|uniref:TonB C-terminal domain-containing protein n=1 Tax=[Phormidium ambiguum] IAM M-71 TaxID=454136 RepID=A0A1U7IKZ9_9CYAN|nr:energy transducer TonB [Phormidium ambiguum]OKH37853.1 hypothetical protein NIES2119_11910 [Phormidium ambiguum IAM M-71]